MATIPGHVPVSDTDRSDKGRHSTPDQEEQSKHPATSQNGTMGSENRCSEGVSFVQREHNTLGKQLLMASVSSQPLMLPLQLTSAKAKDKNNIVCSCETNSFTLPYNMPHCTKSAPLVSGTQAVNTHVTVVPSLTSSVSSKEILHQNTSSSESLKKAQPRPILPRVMPLPITHTGCIGQLQQFISNTLNPMSLPFPMSNTLPQIVTTPAVITTTSQYSSNNDSPLIGQVSVTTKATSTPITSLSTSIIVATATTLSVPATSSSNIPVTTVNKCTTANSITLTSLTSSTSCSSSSLAAISSVTVPSTTRPLPSPKSREEALSIAGKFHFASRNSQVPLYVSEDIVLSGGIAQQNRRRIVHNKVEKRRKEKINGWIEKMAKYLFKNSSKEQKVYKNATLEKAYNYIKLKEEESCKVQNDASVQTELSKVVAHNQEASQTSQTSKEPSEENDSALMNRVSELEEQVKMLTEIMHKHKIPVPNIITQSSRALTQLTQSIARPQSTVQILPAASSAILMPSQNIIIKGPITLPTQRIRQNVSASSSGHLNSVRCTDIISTRAFEAELREPRLVASSEINVCTQSLTSATQPSGPGPGTTNSLAMTAVNNMFVSPQPQYLSQTITSSLPSAVMICTEASPSISQVNSLSLAQSVSQVNNTSVCVTSSSLTDSSSIEVTPVQLQNTTIDSQVGQMFVIRNLVQPHQARNKNTAKPSTVQVSSTPAKKQKTRVSNSDSRASKGRPKRVNSRNSKENVSTANVSSSNSCNTVTTFCLNQIPLPVPHTITAPCTLTPLTVSSSQSVSNTTTEMQLFNTRLPLADMRPVTTGSQMVLSTTMTVTNDWSRNTVSLVPHNCSPSNRQRCQAASQSINSMLHQTSHLVSNLLCNSTTVPHINQSFTVASVLGKQAASECSSDKSTRTSQTSNGTLPREPISDTTSNRNRQECGKSKRTSASVSFGTSEISLATTTGTFAGNNTTSVHRIETDLSASQILPKRIRQSNSENSRLDHHSSVEPARANNQQGSRAGHVQARTSKGTKDSRAGHERPSKSADQVMVNLSIKRSQEGKQRRRNFSNTDNSVQSTAQRTSISQNTIATIGYSPNTTDMPLTHALTTNSSANDLGENLPSALSHVPQPQCRSNSQTENSSRLPRTTAQNRPHSKRLGQQSTEKHRNESGTHKRVENCNIRNNQTNTARMSTNNRTNSSGLPRPHKVMSLANSQQGPNVARRNQSQQCHPGPQPARFSAEALMRSSSVSTSLTGDMIPQHLTGAPVQGGSLPTILNIFAPASVSNMVQQPASGSTLVNVNSTVTPSHNNSNIPVPNMSTFPTIQSTFSNFSAESLIANGSIDNQPMNPAQGNPNQQVNENMLVQQVNQTLFTDFSADALLAGTDTGLSYGIDNIMGRTDPITSASCISPSWLQAVPLTTENSPIKSIVSILESGVAGPSQGLALPHPHGPGTSNSGMANINQSRSNHFDFNWSRPDDPSTSVMAHSMTFSANMSAPMWCWGANPMPASSNQIGPSATVQRYKQPSGSLMQANKPGPSYGNFLLVDSS